MTAKDVSLEILRRLTVKGGVGAILEWGGPGALTLSVPERATITNMGAELGATTSLFPSDEVTRLFLEAQGRGEDYRPLAADPDAVYDQVVEINLSALEPLIACPHSPDRVVPVSEVAGTKVDQVCIGSCTNSSFQDMAKVAAIFRGRVVHPETSVSLSPGSRQVLTMLTECGALTHLLGSGARLLECACGPCIGMGFSPNSGGVSLRTFNRNFEGRSGTADGQVYLVSPETAAASALAGVITDPRTLPPLEDVAQVTTFRIDDSAILLPATPEEGAKLSTVKGPNIKALPESRPVTDQMEAMLTLKVGDNITTDHIMPAGSKILPYRSNIPHLSQYCFEVCDLDFPQRAKAAGNSIIVGGTNYGQGSSREHAALVPLYLGVRAVVAKSFARIHCANLINAGILPLTFASESDYDRLEQGDQLVLTGVLAGLDTGHLTLVNQTQNIEIPVVGQFTKRQKACLLAGGLLSYVAGGEA